MLRRGATAVALVSLLLALWEPCSAAESETPVGKPFRIVSLAPSMTELLFALGAGDRVVAGTRYDDWPPEARKLPKVAGYIDWNMEAILQSKPDLVLGTRELGGEELSRQLGTLKIRAEFLPVFTLEDVYATIRRVGELVGEESHAATLVDKIEQEIRALREKTRSLPKVRVLWVWEKAPVTVAGPKTFAGELISIAGGENIAPDAGERFPRLSLEEILARPPDVILDASMQGREDPKAEAESQAFWARWGSIPAVRNRRVHVVGSTAFLRPGPRLGQAAQAVARLVHPEAFAADPLASERGQP